MNPHYRDYFWKNGKPYGIEKVDSKHFISYKIISDPYYKRISIEKYHFGQFAQTVYDSIFLDFRHLKSPEHTGWQRDLLEEKENKIAYLLRNQDDRAILKEILEFQEHYCRSCMIESIHGILLSTHKMYYTILQDPFNGVILFDQENRVVMKKTYEINPLTEEFDRLISEEWEMNSQLTKCKIDGAN
jgi:hypothetical protein